MLKRLPTYSFLILLASCLQFCALEQIKHESPNVNIIQVGTKFKINLPEDHSNGYLWQLGENFDEKIIQNISAVWHGKEKGIDFNLKALSVGQTTLSLVLRKYNDTINNKTFIVNIINK